MPRPLLDKVARYEARIHRQLLQTMHELEAMQARSKGERSPLARLDLQSLSDEGQINKTGKQSHVHRLTATKTPFDEVSRTREIGPHAAALIGK